MFFFYDDMITKKKYEFSISIVLVPGVLWKGSGSASEGPIAEYAMRLGLFPGNTLPGFLSK